MAPKPAKAAPKEEQQEEENQPIWFKEEEKWELTWPIWHMLPRGERKALAIKYGYKTIGEFEEYMTLRRAVGDSSSTAAVPYDNALLYNQSTAPDESMSTLQSKPSAVKDEEDEGDDDDSSEENEDTLTRQSSTVSAEDLTEAELIECGGLILMLPEELIHSVFEWLPVDAYALLALVSPHWKHLTRTEFVYKRICERCYLNQSKRRTLHVSRFGSYRSMLEIRPRVRAGGGVYLLKYAQVKRIQRDMWTEIPVGAVLETVYYRYFYFQENGTVLYALTTSAPHEMLARFHKTRVTGEPDKTAVWGRYQIQKNRVTVVASHPWHDVRMEMTIQPNGIGGRFTTLSFDRHLSSASGDFDEHYSRDLVEYKVPGEMFRFLKDGRL